MTFLLFTEIYGRYPASHYIKTLMDAVFGVKNFRNEITWKRTSGHGNAKRFGNVADILLYYARNSAVWNDVYGKHSPEQLKRYRHTDEQGRRYLLEDLTAPSVTPERMFTWRGTTPTTRGWKYSHGELEKLFKEGRISLKRDGTVALAGHIKYLDETPGAKLQNIWTDILRVGNTSKERTGYPTQKPLALLERIIKASADREGCTTKVA